ncbi:MAG: ATP-binding protein, partial [Candidatus Anstonellales archaeon]
VVGVRRVGKTSLLNVIYNESKNLKLWIDGRIVKNPKKELLAAIYETAKGGRSKIFGRIEGLGVSFFGLGFDIKLENKTITEMEKKIKNSGRMYVFIDEAQRMEGEELGDVLSYFYDRLPNVSFILSGSEIGLMEKVIGEKDAQHPLYGREITKIHLKRLDKNRSMEYLKIGFKQLGLKIEKEEIEKAVEELDGLIGWLTLYGYESGIKKDRNALERTVERAAMIAASELNSFLKNARDKKLYLTILRNCVGVGWDELHFRVSKGIGKQINPNLFNFCLERLLTYSFVEKKNKKYYLADPILQKSTFLLRGHGMMV